MANEAVLDQVDSYCGRSSSLSEKTEWSVHRSPRPKWESGKLDPILSALLQSWGESFPLVSEDVVTTVTEDTTDLEIAFLGHAAKWERDTRCLSSMTDIMRHPSYQWVINKGKERPREMLQLLLRDLRENERQWFMALATLAETNPVQPKDAGRVSKMSKAWITWGKNEGLL